MNDKKNNTRAVISIFMLFGFITILVTGLLSYGLRYNSLLSNIHTVFGLLFISYGVVHLKNNFKPMVVYLKAGLNRKWILLSTLLITFVAISLAAGIPPFKTVIDIGYAIKELKPIDRHVSQTLFTNLDKQGQELIIEIKTGKHYTGPGYKFMGVTMTGRPQIAIWTEDMAGNYLNTLYVTKKASDSSYYASLFDKKGSRRPEALPHWSHSRGVVSSDGLMMPDKENPITDAITGATPLNNFELKTNVPKEHSKVIVKLEINRSYDYNKFYSKTAFPKDLIYSGTGNNAQPSVIYSAVIDYADNSEYTFMNLIGHGHHSGRDGEIYNDMSKITTAKEMLDRIIIEK